jgi:integrase
MITDTEIKNAKFNERDKAKGGIKPNKRSDSGGLYLEITAASKLWRVAYRFGGKQRTVYVKGAYPAVTLADARGIRDSAKALLAKGIDPIASAKETSSKVSFTALAERWYADMIVTEDKAEGTLKAIKSHKDLLVKVIGSLSANEVRSSDVLAGIQPYRDKGQHHQAKRVRSVASWIFQWGMDHNFCESNPAGSISTKTLKGEKTTNRPALLESETFGQLLRDIASYDTNKFGNLTGLALKLLPLVVTRPYKEFALAEWSEFNFDEARWTIPKRRMKMRDDEARKADGRHMVPLSRQAIAILRQLQAINGDRQYVFAAGRDGKPISHATIGSALVAMGYQGRHCGHGFRSSFSTMVNAEYVGEDENEKRWHNDVVELQLAHLDKSTRGVYMRLGASALWKQRSNLMQHWADRCDAMRGDNVKQIGRAA